MIDPHFVRNLRWSRRSVDEALGVPCVDVVEYALARCLDLVGAAVVHCVGGEQPDGL